MQLPLRAIALSWCIPALALIASAQSKWHAASQPWSRTFGGGFPNERVLDMREGPDGSLRVAARTGSFGQGALGGWLLSLSLGEGDVLSEHVIGRPTLGGVDGAGLAADGGALFTGRDVIDIFHKHDAWVVRVDGNGNILWSNGFTRAGLGRHQLLDAAELADGSWIAAGATSLLDEPPQRAWLVKLNPNGSVAWQFEYRGGETETIHSIVPTLDGGFAVAGTTNSSGAGLEDAFVMKLDAGGAIVWQRTFGGADQDQATEIVELGTGGYAVAAWTNSLTSSGHAPWVLRLGANGQLLWHAVVGSDVWGDLDAITEARDGGLVVFGRVGEPGFQTNDLWTAKLAPDTGAVRWQRAYEGDSGDWGSQALTLSGGDLLFGGEWGSGFPEEDLWLLRTDSSGRTPECNLERKTRFVTSSPSILARAGVTVRELGGALVQPVDFALAASQALVVERCTVD